MIHQISSVQPNTTPALVPSHSRLPYRLLLTSDIPPDQPQSGNSWPEDNRIVGTNRIGITGKNNGADYTFE